MGLIALEDLKSPKKLGVFITIIAAIQFIVVTIIAMFFYPGGYHFFFDYFSTLGRTMTAADHTLPNYPNPISSVMFFIAVVIAGVAIIPFALIIRTLFTEDKKTNIIATAGSIVACVSAPFLIGVALFPSDLYPGRNNLHGISAQGFFIIFAVAIIIYTIAILLNSKYPNWLAVFSIIIAVMAILYAAIDMGIIDAFMQKMVVYSFITWVLINAIKVWQIVEI